MRIAAIILAVVSASGCKTSRSVDWPAAVAPPLGLDKLDGVTTSDDAKRAVPALGEVEHEGHALGMVADGMVARVMFDDLGHVGNVVVTVERCGDLERKLVERWGPATETKALSHLESSWFGASTGWSARVRELAQGRCSIVFLHKSYFATIATPPGALSRVRSGMTTAEAIAAAPRIASSPVAVAADNVVDVVNAITYDHGHVSLTYMLMPTALRAPIVAAWGGGITYDKTSTRWFDPSSGARATLSDVADGVLMRLQFDHYVPFEQWLGDGDEIAAFASPVLGAPLVDIQKAYSDRLRSDSLWLAATEWTEEPFTSVSLRANADGVVSGVAIPIAYDSPITRDAIVGRLEGKWGKAKPAALGWEFASKLYGAIHVVDLGNVLDVQLDYARNGKT